MNNMKAFPPFFWVISNRKNRLFSDLWLFQYRENDNVIRSFQECLPRLLQFFPLLRLLVQGFLDVL